MSWKRKMLEKCKHIDGIRAKKRQRYRDFDGGRLVRELSVTAVMNAVNNEGREVVTGPAAKTEEYWKDQDRFYFGIDRGSSLNGMRNRFGRVKEHIVYPAKTG
jgi:hypothetical protein